MKNKIWISLIVLVIAIITISCQSETESNTASSEISINDDVENNSEQDFKDDSDEAFEDEPAYTTDEYFIKEHSVYRNPIDQYFWSKLNPKDKSETEYRGAQADYQKAWKAEYQNLMKWMKKKCVYNEDKNNLSLLEKSIAKQIDREKKVLKTDLTAAYKINPDPSKVKNSVSRMSCMGKGTDRLTEIEGGLYRDVCMRILNLAGYDEYEFKFCETD